MEKSFLREFNALGLQLRPQAARCVTAYLREVSSQHSQDEVQKTAERLTELTRSYFKSQRGNGRPVIDKDIIEFVIEQCRSSGSGASGGGEEDVEMTDAQHGIDTMGLGDGIQIYDALHDIQQFDYKPARKEWVMSLKASRLLAHPDQKAKIMRDRYQVLWQRLFLTGEMVPASQLVGGATTKLQVVTPVESLAGNPGRKLSFGLLSKVAGGIATEWELEDLHKVVPIKLTFSESHHLITDGCFVLAEGEMRDGVFNVEKLEIPKALSREESFRLDQVPSQIFGGNLTQKQLDVLRENEPADGSGMYVVLADVHLDDARVLQKLADLFQGYEMTVPPTAYVFMGNFCSKPFGPTATSVQSYIDGFERLRILLAQLAKHHAHGTRFVFMTGPHDPGVSTLPRPPLTKHLTAHLSRHVPNVVLATNPCRIRHFSREIVFFRSDVLRLLRRHEALRLREPGQGTAPSRDHVRDEMVRLLLDQSHLAPLPLEEANILWSFDHALRLYPLPSAVMVGGGTEGFDVKYQGCTFASIGAFRASSGFSFYAYYPSQDSAEPCGIPDRAG